MKPSCSSLTPRVDVEYSPDRCARAQSAAVAMWKRCVVISSLRLGVVGGVGSEEPVARVVEPAQGVVVHDDAPDAPVLGQDPRLGLDDLRGEHARDGCQQGVAVEELEV